LIDRRQRLPLHGTVIRGPAWAFRVSSAYITRPPVMSGSGHRRSPPEITARPQAVMYPFGGTRASPFCALPAISRTHDTRLIVIRSWRCLIPRVAQQPLLPGPVMHPPASGDRSVEEGARATSP
jgi:hypothetical protein